MSPHFEVFEDRFGFFRWRLKAGNGEIVASSEDYTRREDAERGGRDMVAAVLEIYDEAKTMSGIPFEQR